MNPQLLEASGACFIAILMAAYAATRSQRSVGQILIVGLMGGTVLWTFGVALAVVLEGEAATWAALGSFIGVFAVPPMWLLLSVRFSGISWPRLGPGLIGLAVGPSIAFLLLLATNEAHHLFIARVDLLATSPPDHWAGPLYWLWIGWAYLLILAGCSLYVLRSFRRIGRDSRGGAWVLCGAALIPLVASLVHHVSDLDASHDRTPLFLGVSIFFIFLADWRFHLLETIPIARRDVIDHLADGVVLADAQGRILDMNRAAEAMMESTLAHMKGRLLVEVVAEQARGRMQYDAARFMAIVGGLCVNPGGFHTRVENSAGRIFEIRGASVTDGRGDVNGLYLILRDCTDAERYEELLSRSRRFEAVAGLAAGVAHQVNDPLAYVRANVCHVERTLRARCLEMGEGDPAGRHEVEEARAALVESLDGVEKIAEVVERVRRFARNDPSAVGAVDVHRVVDDAIALSGLTSCEDVRFEVIRARDPGRVEGSREILTEAVLDVLTLMRSEIEKSIEFTVRCRQQQGMIGIRIEARGPDEQLGVDAGGEAPALDSIRTPDADARSRGRELRLAARICREHGGELVVAEFTPHRACVTLKLPASDPAEARPL